ncbi:MAG: CinA family protein, partial [Pseudomonadota bacterium]
GGLISQRLTSISGSSDYFERGLVVYSNRAKMELLDVPAEVLEKHGAVSAETAHLMARMVREKSGADLGLASTGLAGPTGATETKPVGTVFLGLASKAGVGVKHFWFPGARSQVNMLTSQTALSWLYRYLTDDTFLFRH